jgi:tRNA(Ile)-lysidine synthase
LGKIRPPSWSKSAIRLGDAIPAARLHPRVRRWIARQAREGETWGVAVSGGADSVALLLLLWAHFPGKRKQMLVLHYDHALRPDSATDAQFVQQLAKGLGLRFVTERRTPGGAVSEAALRADRMRFFRTQLAAHSARIVFFGHQRDDIAETMLMRLARGSGASGLCAPRPAREFPDGLTHLRPLLDLEHAELCQVLQAAGAVWREDSSNAKGDYLRNRLRHDVLPAWRAADGSRDLNAGVARARAALEEDAEALENLTAELMRDLPQGAPLTLSRISGQPRAVVRRALHWWLHVNEAGRSLNAQAFDTVFAALISAQPGRWSAGPGRWLALDKSALRMMGGETVVAAAWGPFPLRAGRTVHLPDGAWLKARRVIVDRKLLNALCDGKINPAARAYLAPPKRAGAGFLVRPWQPGDRYRPLGAPGRRKLQDLFTDKKIPAKERHRLPVVCNEANEPLWAPGLAPAHDHRVTAAARAALELTYSPFRDTINNFSDHP